MISRLKTGCEEGVWDCLTIVQIFLTTSGIIANGVVALDLPERADEPQAGTQTDTQTLARTHAKGDSWPAQAPAVASSAPDGPASLLAPWRQWRCCAARSTKLVCWVEAKYGCLSNKLLR